MAGISYSFVESGMVNPHQNIIPLQSGNAFIDSSIENPGTDLTIAGGQNTTFLLTYNSDTDIATYGSDDNVNFSFFYQNIGSGYTLINAPGVLTINAPTTTTPGNAPYIYLPILVGGTNYKIRLLRP